MNILDLDPFSCNWKTILKKSINNVESLSKHISITKEEKQQLENKFFNINPYYISLIDKDNANDPIRKSVIPSSNEDLILDCEKEDSLNENETSPTKCLVHRYPDRVLFLVTNYCSTICRFCTRSRLVFNEKKNLCNKNEWTKAIDYIKNHSEIRDIIISGGDPLTLQDNQIEWLLKNLRNIPHVEIIRIGTKIPVSLPQRITKRLCNILKKYSPLYININIIHSNELTKQSKKACDRLVESGIVLGSQTVLLKDINDNVDTMKKLMQKLLIFRIKPYYIYAGDLVQGTSHFRSTINKGLEIMKGLRGWTSGLCNPYFVVDAPNGGGKIPLLPKYIEKIEDDKYYLKNYKDNNYTYIN